MSITPFQAFLSSDKEYVQAHYPNAKSITRIKPRGGREYLVDTGDDCSALSGNAAAAWKAARDRLWRKTRYENATALSFSWDKRSTVLNSLNDTIMLAAIASGRNAIYDELYVSLLRLRHQFRGVI